MKFLVIGSGGREHALAWKLKQSALVETVFVAPGNAGTACEPGVKNIPIAADDILALAEFAEKEGIELTVVGPEIPLSLGITDLFEQRGLLCLGPTQAAAQLEVSKAFCKDFMLSHQIPTAQSYVFTDFTLAEAWLKQQSRFPVVIKADGLAAGKGVTIAHDFMEAKNCIQALLLEHCLGVAGQKIVIEEFIHGVEASFIVLTDGITAIPFVAAQDHKTRDEGGKGPNTGGMGAYSPTSILTPELEREVMERVIYPTLRGMAECGKPYRGFLYAGLMITPDSQIKVIEFNCRLGDPETQVILFRLQSDLAQAFLAAFKGDLNQVTFSWDPRPAVGVVMVAQGYPDQYPKDEVISGLPTLEQSGCKVFHAGTRLEAGEVRTHGGRVLCVTALGDSLQAAKNRVYQQVSQIHWDHVYYRRDIG